MALTNDQITAQNFKDFYDQIYPYLGQGGGGGGSIADFTGATDQADGAHGLVPAPQAGDEGKVLFGNGSWGNIVMPSVDLSMLSNEAFIFSETEKPVGMWTDRKILYAKTVDFGALPNNTSKGVSSGLSNVLIVGMHGITYKSGYAHTLPNPAASNAVEEWHYDYSTNNIVIITREDRSSYTNTYITIFYTKTTDSPLASDEKYAGLTASGEVIYKRSFGLSPSSQAQTQTWTEINDIDCQSVGVDKIINGQVLDDHTYYPMALDYKPSASSKLRIMNFRNVDVAIKTIILYYTKTS